MSIHPSWAMTVAALGLWLPQAGLALGVDDLLVSDHVHTAFVADTRVTPRDIDVSTFAGIVILTGTLSDLTEKRYAELEAKKIEGVRGVINELEIGAIDGTDAGITRTIHRRLAGGGVNPGQSEVLVLGGHVLLAGTVSSDSQKREAEFLAGEVAGVHSIVNGLLVRPKPLRPDATIRTDVLGELGRDVYLVDSPLTVAVDEGRVALAGEVADDYEKRRAYADAARVPNVVAIANGIEVVPARRVWRIEDGVRTTQPVVLDSEISSALRDELWQDPRVKAPMSIAVAADLGRITLRGSVERARQREVAGDDATGVVGVRSLNNLIEIEPG